MVKKRNSDLQGVGNTRHLTRLLNVFKEADVNLIWSEIFERIGGNGRQVKDALNWLIGNGLVLKVKVRRVRTGRSKSKCRYDTRSYAINPLFLEEKDGV